MLMYKDSKYTSSSYDFPNNTSWEDKQRPEYNKKMCDYFYSQHLNNMTSIGINQQEKFNQLRLMAMGNQPEDWYKSWLSGGRAPSGYDIDSFFSTTRHDAKKGFKNLDFTIVSMFPKIMSIIISIIKNIDYNLKVDVIDQMSGAEEEDKMIRAYVRSLFGEALDYISKENGLPVDVDDVTGTFQELEQVKAEGGFKADHAVNLAKLLKWTESHSGWDDHIYENIILDAVTVRSIALMEYFDYETRTSKWKRLDPGKVICQYSDKNNHDDVDYIGYQDEMRISELMSIFPDVKREDWVGLAKKYENYSHNSIPNDNNDSWGNNYVPYIRMCWIDTKNQKYIKTDKGRVYKNKSKEELLKDNKTNIDYSTRIAFEACMIIGTDYVWGYGVMKNQANPSKRRPILPIYFYTFPYKSLVERLTPIMHQLQIAWLKYQNALMTAHPGGIAIDINMISNITDGGKKVPFMDLITMWFEKGILPYKLSMTGKYQGGNPLPISNIPSDLISKLNDYLTVISSIGKFIEELTGFSTVALGSTPTADQQVGTTQMAYSATLNSLKHVVDGCKIGKQFMGSVSAERMRIYMQVDPSTRKVYESVIGESGVNTITTAKKRMVQYGTSCVARPDDIEKQGLFNDLEQSYKNYMSGQPGINQGQKVKLRAMVNQGTDLLFIGQIMDSWIRYDEIKKDKRTEKNSKIQGQILAQQEQAKSQGEAQLIQSRAQADDYVKQREIMAEKDKELAVVQEKNKAERVKSNKEYENNLMNESVNERSRV